MVPENNHTPPLEGIRNSREDGGGGGAKLEFPEGWGHRENPFCGGGGGGE